MNVDNSIIEAIVVDVDDFILTTVEKYKIHPLGLSSIIMGRLINLNKLVGCDESFVKLISTINEDQQEDENKVLH